MGDDSHRSPPAVPNYRRCHTPRFPMNGCNLVSAFNLRQSTRIQDMLNPAACRRVRSTANPAAPGPAKRSISNSAHGRGFPGSDLSLCLRPWRRAQTRANECRLALSACFRFQLRGWKEGCPLLHNPARCLHQQLSCRTTRSFQRFPEHRNWRGGKRLRTQVVGVSIAGQLRRAFSSADLETLLPGRWKAAYHPALLYEAGRDERASR